MESGSWRRKRPGSGDVDTEKYDKNKSERYKNIGILNGCKEKTIYNSNEKRRLKFLDHVLRHNEFSLDVC